MKYLEYRIFHQISQKMLLLALNKNSILVRCQILSGLKFDSELVSVHTTYFYVILSSVFLFCYVSILDRILGVFILVVHMISSCLSMKRLNFKQIEFQTYEFRTQSEIGLAKCLNYSSKEEKGNQLSHCSDFQLLLHPQ